MSKRDFIALADAIREHNERNHDIHEVGCGPDLFEEEHIAVLARFCQSQNSAFKRDRWLSYIAGECGPNGETVKK